MPNGQLEVFLLRPLQPQERQDWQVEQERFLELQVRSLELPLAELRAPSPGLLLPQLNPLEVASSAAWVEKTPRDPPRPVSR